MNALPHTRDEKDVRATQMLKVRARLSASGGLAQPGPLGEGPVVVALPRHRQPCHELLLRKAVRLRVDACPFVANGLNEVERLLSERWRRERRCLPGSLQNPCTSKPWSSRA